MKDRFLLLLTAMGFAISAWAFLRYLAADAMPIIFTVVLASTVVDNMCLRREVLKLKQIKPDDQPAAE